MLTMHKVICDAVSTLLNTRKIRTKKNRRVVVYYEKMCFINLIIIINAGISRRGVR